MLPYERMRTLAATNSKKDKEQLLTDAFMGQEWQFYQGCRLCLDNLITFGVKKVPEILEDDGEPGDYSFNDFLDLTTKLQARQLTGHAARDAILEAATRCHVPTWNEFYRRILLKNLGVGVDTSINKVLKKLVATHPKAKDFFIPVFECQLAHNGEEPVHQKKIRGKKLIDTKLDGMRLLTVMNKETGTIGMFSRNGQPINTFPEMIATLQLVLRHLPGSVVLDGELMSPLGFQHLMTLVKRDEPHPDTAIIEYALFDIVPMKDFFEGYCAKPQRERRMALETIQSCGMFSKFDGWEVPDFISKIYVVPQIDVDLDTPEGRAAFAEYNRQAIADGYEGIMIKNPDAPYEGKRTAAWLKSKPTIEVTMEIVGLDAGDPDKKYANTLGALVCYGFDNGIEINSNVSGGLPDELREEIWNNQEKYMGMIVEIIADKLTLEEGEIIHSLRFPRLKGFRGRVPGEKL